MVSVLLPMVSIFSVSILTESEKAKTFALLILLFSLSSFVLHDVIMFKQQKASTDKVCMGLEQQTFKTNVIGFITIINRLEKPVDLCIYRLDDGPQIFGVVGKIELVFIQY